MSVGGSILTNVHFFNKTLFVEGITGPYYRWLSSGTFFAHFFNEKETPSFRCNK